MKKPLPSPATHKLTLTHNLKDPTKGTKIITFRLWRELSTDIYVWTIEFQLPLGFIMIYEVGTYPMKVIGGILISNH